MNPWLQFAQEIAPLIAGFVKDHIAKHGTSPTDDDVKNWLATDVTAVDAVSNAWLAAHPDIPTNPPVQ